VLFFSIPLEKNAEVFGKTKFYQANVTGVATGEEQESFGAAVFSECK
jgi:hypothetical protein